MKFGLLSKWVAVMLSCVLSSSTVKARLMGFKLHGTHSCHQRINPLLASSTCPYNTALVIRTPTKWRTLKRWRAMIVELKSFHCIAIAQFIKLYQQWIRRALQWWHFIHHHPSTTWGYATIIPVTQGFRTCLLANNVYMYCLFQ